MVMTHEPDTVTGSGRPPGGKPPAPARLDNRPDPEGNDGFWLSRLFWFLVLGIVGILGILVRRLFQRRSA